MELFKRRVRLSVATSVQVNDYKSDGVQVLEIEDLRVQFNVKKTGGKEPNTAEVTVTNLSPRHRADLQTKGVRFLLQAGYDTSIGQLFAGDIRTIDHVRDGANWNTVLRSGDGERAWRWAWVNESFVAGTPASQVIEALGRALGVGLGNLLSQAAKATEQYVSGYVAYGPASRELDKVLRAHGFTWSIQDGELQILREGETAGVLVPELSPDSGLVGSPEMAAPEKKGGAPLLKARCLLRPAIRPGGTVVLKSQRHNGSFLVRKVEHVGDTAGGDWYTNWQGTAL